MAQKFYVVWSGRQTGVFTDRASTQRAVEKYAGARFKSFPTRAEAEKAFARGMDTSIAPKTAGGQKTRGERAARHTAHQFDVSIYCDGACEPNPGHAGSGIVLYRAGKLAELLFCLYNPMGTNNTAELNAIYRRIKEELHLTHVAGHVGTEGNELADRMAMLAVQSKEKELRLYQETMDIPTLLKMRAG